jgi:hypothetical protein
MRVVDYGCRILHFLSWPCEDENEQTDRERTFCIHPCFVVGKPCRQNFCKSFGPSRIRTCDQGIKSLLPLYPHKIGMAIADSSTDKDL